MTKENREENEVIIPKETVTLPEVLIFLGCLLAILIGFLFYLRFSGYSVFSDYYKKKAINYPTLKIEKSLTSSNFELRVTESELSGLINLSRDDFPLKKASVKILPEAIRLSGKTANGFWGVPVEIDFLPIASNGKVIFTIKEIKAGGVVAPPKIADALTPKVNGIFDHIFGDQKVDIREVKLMVGFLYFEGTKE